VSASKKRWKATIYYDGKVRNLGTFNTKQEAAPTYDREARQRGEGRPLNYSIKAAEEAADPYDPGRQGSAGKVGR
jgi:hypothetical protein